MEQLNKMAPKDVRALIREGTINGPTAGMSGGYAQANLVVLKKDSAFDFLLFCQRNQKPCPVLDVTEAGSPVPSLGAPDADIRTDFPKYRIYRHGILTEEVSDITPYWEDDFVGFLIGCSFSFEQALINNGIAVRHIDEGTNVSMYKTNIDCVPAGAFHGQMVVSMRPVPERLAVRLCTSDLAFSGCARRADPYRQSGSNRDSRSRETGFRRCRSHS